MLGLWIDRQPVPVLRCLSEATEWEGGTGMCPAGIGASAIEGNGAAKWAWAVEQAYYQGVARRFDDLSARFGDARIGRLISARARKRLAELQAQLDRVSYTDARPGVADPPAHVSVTVRQSYEAVTV